MRAGSAPAVCWYERPAASVLILFVAALVIRAVQFGNPVIQIDEQFYLLVGDRMWEGALPYTDIWDRKPIGLFLIYAAIRALGGEGIWQYQLVATSFAAATAFLIQRLARRLASPPAALIAGLLYLIFLMPNGGDGGQAPVFYNLFTASAALALMRVIERPAFDRCAFQFACGAMALLGIALQIKYSVLFESMYFGLVLIALMLRQGLAFSKLALAISIWIALALAPTIAAILAYRAFGHLPDFLFANFESIFLRPTSIDGDARPRLGKIAVRVAPLCLLAIIGLWRGLKEHGDVSIGRFLGVWAIVATSALLVFGTYHDHYALPLLLPLAIAAAPAWDTPRIGRPMILAVALAGAALGYATVKNNRIARGTGDESRAIADYVRPRLHGSLFVFSGDPILYHLTGSALPTRWSFPTLLSEKRDIGTMQVDQVTELARIMAARPQFVVARDYPFADASPAAWRFMQGELAAHYRIALVRTVKHTRQILYERLPTGGAR